MAVLASGFACKKPYNPKVVTGNSNYMVVEGVINTGNDSTNIKLSRTVKVNSKQSSSPESGAVVNVEDNGNGSYPVPELGNGKYGAPPLGLDSTKQYRLRIRTTDGKEYLSDFSQAKSTPPIDSIGFTITNTGVQIYVNTHI